MTERIYLRHFWFGWFGMVLLTFVTSTKLRLSSTGTGDYHWRIYHPDIFQATHSHSAWLWVGAVSTAN